MNINTKRFFTLDNGIIASTAIVFLLGVYLISRPFLPEVSKKYQSTTDQTKGYHYQTKLAADYAQAHNVKLPDLKPLPKVNTLIIPQIGVNNEIFEGSNERTLELGVWHKPGTGIPGVESNVVLAAHRFVGTNTPNIFYNLDKLKIGDRFNIIWLGHEYIYEVTETLDVNADQVEIENPTPNQMVTLYTCTPLWTSARRLVVRAKPIIVTAEK